MVANFPCTAGMTADDEQSPPKMAQKSVGTCVTCCGFETSVAVVEKKTSKKTQLDKKG
jgi:hypothetical protein